MVKSGMIRRREAALPWAPHCGLPRRQHKPFAWVDYVLKLRQSARSGRLCFSWHNQASVVLTSLLWLMPLARYCLFFPLLLHFALASAAVAQVSAGGLGTRINGSQFGSCHVGSCAVQGGTGAGVNLFHRFAQFDTRSGLKDVRIDTAGRRNVILSVTSPAGTFLNVPLKLTDPANLFLLSPGGLWLGQGGGFQKVSNLLLSTGVALDLPGGRFHAINSGRSDLAGLGVGPELRFDAVAIPAGQRLVIGAQGGGSLLIDRALLNIEGGVVIDATTGPLVLRQAQLSAGESLRLSGHGFALQDSSLSVGEPGRRGPMELHTTQDPLNGSFASGLLERVRLIGNQVSVSAGSLRLLDSQIIAPKGWVELQTTNPVGQAADLSVIGSRIDLNPSQAADLWSPQILRRQSSDAHLQEIHNPAPHIGLFSRGNLQIERSVLEASLLLPPGSEPAPETILSALPERAGLIFAEAAGGIGLSASTLRADASHNLAGYLLMEAGRDLQGVESQGELAVRDSQLSTSSGAGAGAIILQADHGLTVRNSTLQAMTDRFPVVAGFQPPPGVQPAFLGGQITLYNQSESWPLLVSASTLAANHHTALGPLASPFLASNPDENGFGSFGSSLDGWTLGLKYFYSGGFLQIYSRAGIRIEQDSLLDASSRDPLSGQMENIAGTISVLSDGKAPIEIEGSRLEARSSSARNSSDYPTKTGLMFIYGDDAISFRDARLDLTVASPVAPEGLSVLPFLSIEAAGPLTVQGNSVFRSQLEVRGVPVPDEEHLSINLYDGLIPPDAIESETLTRILTDEGKLDGLAGFFKLYKAGELFQAFDNVVAANRIVFERTYTASTSALPAWPLPLAASTIAGLPPQPLPLQPSDRADKLALALDSDGDAGQKLLEGQQLALADTVASLGLAPGSGRVRSVADLQQRLGRIEQQRLASLAPYRPAIVQLGLSEMPGEQVQLNGILLTSRGEPRSFSRVLPAERLRSTIRAFQRQVIRQERIDPAITDGPATQLAAWLLGPLADALRSSGANALLMAVDRGLQAIPYGALPFGEQFLVERFALSVSPSLGLLDLETDRGPGGGLLLAAGASRFRQSLQPLPMVPQELAALAVEQSAAVLLDEEFTVEALQQRAAEERFWQLHIATHADFQPGQEDAAKLFTSRDSMSLKALRQSLQQRAPERPLDLITLSACHTALGDEQSELGFVGTALQAGARSAIGTLWEVEDAATAAFFIQFYRFQRSGLGKDQALQATAQAFRSGAVRLAGAALVGPRVTQAGDALLLNVASAEERRRLSDGLRHPHFWAGMVLTGGPW